LRKYNYKRMSATIILSLMVFLVMLYVLLQASGFEIGAILLVLIPAFAFNIV